MNTFQRMACLVVLVGSAWLPSQVSAESEQLYVSGMDIDNMEPNLMMAWLENVRDILIDASPFLEGILIPESALADLEEEEFSYEGEEFK